MSVQRDAIRTKRESRRLRLQADPTAQPGVRALIASPSIDTFRCVAAHAVIANGAARVAPSVLAALKLDDGAEALVWTDNAR